MHFRIYRQVPAGGVALMLRVTTLYASSAVATAAYYTRYLAQAPGEEPGVWSGRQAEGLGLAGRVDADDLQRLLEGRDPATGTPLGSSAGRPDDGRRVEWCGRWPGSMRRSRRRSRVSVWWALTGDPGLLEAHDVAVRRSARAPGAVRGDDPGAGRTVAACIWTRGGLSVATFRQTTSRADDPQLHTHAVVSAKVQTEDGRWLALDARYLKRHQRMLGGLYQSVLRAELSHRYGVAWEPIVNGQAELAGMPARAGRGVLEAHQPRSTTRWRRRWPSSGSAQGRDPTAGNGRR